MHRRILRQPPTDPADDVRQDADDVEDVLRRAATVTGYRAFFDAAESCGAAGRRACAGLGHAGGAAGGDNSPSTAGGLNSVAHVRQGRPPLERRTEAAELIFAIAALLAERAEWHELHGDRASAAGAPPIKEEDCRSHANTAGGDG